MVPGSSLGGAGPKANICDTDGGLWIAAGIAAVERDIVGPAFAALGDATALGAT